MFPSPSVVVKSSLKTVEGTFEWKREVNHDWAVRSLMPKSPKSDLKMKQKVESGKLLPPEYFRKDILGGLMRVEVYGTVNSNPEFNVVIPYGSLTDLLSGSAGILRLTFMLHSREGQLLGTPLFRFDVGQLFDVAENLAIKTFVSNPYLRIFTASFKGLLKNVRDALPVIVCTSSLTLPDHGNTNYNPITMSVESELNIMEVEIADQDPRERALAAQDDVMRVYIERLKQQLERGETPLDIVKGKLLTPTTDMDSDDDETIQLVQWGENPLVLEMRL